MRFGVVILPERRWADAKPLWQRAEELGFDHAWTYDHLTWRSFRDAPWFTAIPTLTAAAISTSRMMLGPLVASPNFRHPLTLAKDVIALDDISGGRVVLGVGSGGTGWDATMLAQTEWSPSERAQRFEEFVALLDLLLKEQVTSYRGSFYAVAGARTYPGCVQSPRAPLAIAAAGRRAMAVAASHADIWVTTGDRSGDGRVSAADGAAVVAQQVARLVEACEAVRRDANEIGRLVVSGPELDSGLASTEKFRDTVGRYEDAGVTDFVVHWPRESDPYQGDRDLFERIFTEMQPARSPERKEAVPETR